MRTLAVIVAATVAFVLEETWRRGYGAAVLFGTRQWCRARPDRLYEPDVVA